MSAVVDKVTGLPEGWIKTTLGELVEYVTSGSRDWKKYYSEKGSAFIRTQNINTNKLLLDDVAYVDLPDKVEGKRTRIYKDDLLITITGANVGKVAHVNKEIEEAYVSQSVALVRLKDKKMAPYLYYHLRTREGASSQLESLAYGMGRPVLNLDNIKEVQITLAPAEQQKRIVAKIEELFSHIDAGIEALKKAKKLLKQYRQSVLKAAVTGELTKGWREANKDNLEPASQLLERILETRHQLWEEQQLEQFKAKGKIPKDDKWKGMYKEPQMPDVSDLPEIPQDWLWVSMGVLCEKITDGTHHSPLNGPEGDFKYITAKNIKPWKVILHNITYVDKKVHEEIYSRCDVKKGDVLYIKDGATTGVAALNKLDEEFSLLSSVGVLRFPSDCYGEYFVSALNSPLIKDMLLLKIAGVAITRLTLSKLKEGFITLPPVKEQEEIVKVVEEKLSTTEHLDNELDEQLLKAERNKQSILASAFSGRFGGF